MPSSPSARIITVLNLKGGVGKTHTVWLLAGVAEERGKRLLAIDCDGRGSLTRTLLPDNAAPQPGLETLINPAANATAEELVRKTRFSHIDLVPASAALGPFDLTNQRSWEQADSHLSLVDTVAALRGRYDFIVFDCPPRFSLVSLAALCASEFVVIPLEAAGWEAQRIARVTSAIAFMQDNYNRGLHLLGYVASRVNLARSCERSCLKTLRAHFGNLAFDTVIPERTPFQESMTLGVPITLHAPASAEAGIARRLFAEVQRRISRASRQGHSRREKDVQQVIGAAA